eukprot:Skav203617  [mRNA]  locus=scaffold935:675540:677471:- [translate_table: standard]
MEEAHGHLQFQRKTLVCTQADEMYYENEGERSALLSDLLQGLEAVAQVQPAPDVKDDRRCQTWLWVQTMVENGRGRTESPQNAMFRWLWVNISQPTGDNKRQNYWETVLMMGEPGVQGEMTRSHG